MLTGQKAGFSTNAPAAKSFFVMARTDPARYSQRHSEIAGELVSLLEKIHTALVWLQEALP